ncbi:MAG: DUF4185 domain-containing protein [Bacteroidetes bacterium]|jgi:hypothetical protein|nr:DUF4185 domain-containing protein [Bacteroidota bacterium]MBT5425542.1 DUF4185 domain-containing protein [Bacteroidota bacterium]MBT7092143.1 DUF4185 domain-containing protein [Bacteroidota bacterium]MBT7464178.1 DUF4185 domain-containing protein [Bacteroidota bacterium]
MLRTIRNTSFLVFMIISCFSLSGQTRAVVENAIPDVEWDAAFTRTEGWTGGDVAGTVNMGDGRTVWMFGDSWIGKVGEGKHVGGSHMINNVIAIHDSSELGSVRAPLYKDIHFAWGPNNSENKPTAWIIPKTRTDGEWYWPSGGGVVIPGCNGTQKLIVFLFHLARRGEEDSSWNFKHIGSAMAIVDDAQETIEKWKTRQLTIPYSTKPESATHIHSPRTINWGVSAILQIKEPLHEKSGFLYIYGIDDSEVLNKKLFLARVYPDDVEKLDQWQFFSGEDNWSAFLGDAISIAENVPSELSVNEDVRLNADTFVMVHSEPLFGRKIMIRRAPNPEGPWSDPEPIYTVPGLDRGKEYFTYAAKGHLHLSRQNELLVTYIINANSIWEMAIDAAIYRPRFIRASLHPDL